jgi:hypothetical protein
MPDKNTKKANVFDMQTAVATANQVPPAGSECHVTDNGQANLKSVTDTSFIKNLSLGQHQNLTRTADHVEHFQNNQIVTVQGSQTTAAQQKITITSTENEIHVIAATAIILEVGESKIVMTKDGKIEITGIDIDVKASEHNTIIGQKRVDINPQDAVVAQKQPDIRPMGPNVA